MNINKTSSSGWFGRDDLDGLEEKAKSGWGGRVVGVVRWIWWMAWLGWLG